MKPGLTLVVFTFLFSIHLTAQEKIQASSDWLYSSVHSVIIPEHEHFRKRVTSPDGQKFVTAELDGDGDMQKLKVAVGRRTFPLKMEGAGAEVLWSPNSRWLAVTYTYCCSGFSPYLRVYEVSQSGVRDLKIEGSLAKGFGKGIRCDGWTASQWALTAAVKWLDADHLLAAVQIPNVSVCDSMGVFELREISLPQLTVIKTYGQLEAKKLFRRDLGGNLLGARDTCIRNPKSCWIQSQHQQQ